MEMVAWLAGEKHSDEPQCTSPVIAAFVRGFNDAIPSDAGRHYYLRGWIPRLVNTAGEEAAEERRILVVVDFLVRDLLPMLLREQGRGDVAAGFAGMKPIVTRTGAILAGLAVQQETGHRDVCWAIKMATRNQAPRHWVPTAARLIREIATPAAYDRGLRLLSRLVRVGEGRVANPDRSRRIAPPSA